jgi:cobalt-precorrin-5B (C1)-methyltransferase
MACAKKKELRSGFTTGTAAAAAAKAALLYLRDDRCPQTVDIALLNGKTLVIEIRGCHREGAAAVCTVIKDAGDDPDVTHKAEIGARVTLTACSGQTDETDRIVIGGGDGVGMVTKPGLEVPPGQPAINPGPRKMIRRAVGDVVGRDKGAWRVQIEIFVPRGAELARKTLNARLGIIGGISILGTTGEVRPMSHEAYTATIGSALSVARAAGLKQVVLTTGRRSERYAQARLKELPDEAFIQIGDYFRHALQTAEALGLRSVCLAVFFGKALKMAQGFAHTHAARSRIDFRSLAVWIGQACGDRRLGQEIRDVNTARQAFELIRPACPGFFGHVGRRIAEAARRFTADVAIDVIIFDYQGDPVYDSIHRTKEN